MARVAAAWTPGFRDLRLAELLIGRLCHDLAGGLGTVAGALDLARLERDGDTEALGLAADAAIAGVRRLRLLRAAWGGGDGALTLADLRQLATGLAKPRLAVALDGIEAAEGFTAGGARLLLNVLLLGTECLPRGGRLTVNGDVGGEILVRIEGPGAAWTPGLPACLADPAAAWAAVEACGDDGEGLQCAMAALVAHDTGLSASVLMSVQGRTVPPLLLRLTPGAG